MPLTFANPKEWDLFEQGDRVSVIGLNGLAPGKSVDVLIHKADGKEINIEANHSMTAQQIGWFKAGSALNALNS